MLLLWQVWEVVCRGVQMLSMYCTVLEGSGTYFKSKRSDYPEMKYCEIYDHFKGNKGEEEHVN